MIRPVLSIKNACVNYNNHCIFTNLDLNLAQGQWIGLLGPSGVGKSSLLRWIAGLIPRNTDASITTTTGAPITESIAFMAQSDLLLPWFSVLDNALLSFKLVTTPKALWLDKVDQAKSLLIQVGLKDYLKAYPKSLSGGMRQRVALVRTLLMDKPIILMDEPFQAIDAITRYKLQDLAATILQSKTILFITHDPQEALRLANKIYIMQGSPATLKFFTDLTNPIPRSLNDAKSAALQAELYQALTNAHQEPL